jgi:cell division septal protein FtsQ
MGRLDDIIERNRDPKAAAQKTTAAEKAKREAVAAGDVKPSPPENRLANILDRNRNPKTRQGFFAGVGIALFLLLILGLMVFTDLGLRKPEQKPIAPVDHSGDKHVDGVQLR